MRDFEDGSRGLSQKIMASFKAFKWRVRTQSNFVCGASDGVRSWLHKSVALHKDLTGSGRRRSVAVRQL